MRFLAVLLTAIVIAPLTAWAQETYQIKPGDVVRIEVLEDSSINRESLVLPDGRVSVPLVGTVQVGGRSVDQVRADVIEKLRPNFASDPTVFVSLSQLSEPREAKRKRSTGTSRVTVYVLGEVGAPGGLEIKRNTTVLQALALVGGFSKFAATKRMQLRRADASGVEKIYSVNYQDILAGKSNIGTTVLREGDVIVVPQRRLFE
ncbi:MAG: polysaccharide biosynthesis/export family protein [Sedimentitalea sp.]